jgi:hypothetical protein
LEARVSGSFDEHSSRPLWKYSLGILICNLDPTWMLVAQVRMKVYLEWRLMLVNVELTPRLHYLI